MALSEQERRWFTFQAHLLRVVDGDTVDLRVDLGFETSQTVRIRLANVDAAEVYGVSHDSEEYELGMKQKDFVENWLIDHTHGKGDWPFILETEKVTGKYGRYIGEIISKEDGDVLTEDLIKQYPTTEKQYE